MAGLKVLRRQDTAGMPEDYDLQAPRYGFGVSWVEGARRVDIDLQCVVADDTGAITDCAYYNNLKAARGITHSGDEAVGKPNHINEIVWVNFRRLPPNVSVLVFVVAAYSGGSLQDVVDGKLHVFQERESNEIALFQMERSAAAVDVVAAMFRGPEGWKMRVIDLPAQDGQHFMDILPLMADVIRSFIPSAPSRQKVCFAMEKGGVLDLPRSLGKITVGLGWDVDAGKVDLDVSAILMDKDATELEAVFFGRLESRDHGIMHSGDNLTGEGDGDDEQIVVNLDQIGAVVQQVFFCVNTYTKDRFFTHVAQPYCRVVDDASGAELCRYSLRDAGSESGLLIARIAREVGGRWGFHALGLPCRGRMWKDSLPQVRATCGVRTGDLMARSMTTQEWGAEPSAPPGPYAPAAAPVVMPPAACSKEKCIVQ